MTIPGARGPVPEVPDAPKGLRVGFVPGVTLTKWRRVWAERLPRVPLELTEVAVGEQERAVADGDVDACFVRLPMASDGVHLIRLYDEQPVAWIAKDHPIALFDEIASGDLADEVVLTEVTASALAAVAGADAVLAVPASVARSSSRRDLVYRPIADAPATTIALVWRRDDPNPWIEEWVGIVRGRTANSARTVQERERAGVAGAKRRPSAGARTVRGGRRKAR